MKRILKLSPALVILSVSAISLLSLPEGYAKAQNSKERDLNDGWYVMKSGDTPWGYFHEVIKEKDEKYFYRYDMVKRENGEIFKENIGAVAQSSLEPVAFHLNKAGPLLAQTITATYRTEANAGVFTIKTATASDSKSAAENQFERRVDKNTILEVFFPVWVHQHWNELRPKFKQTLTVLAEDVEQGTFLPKRAEITFLGEKSLQQTPCKELGIEFNGTPAKWCLSSSGALVEMTLGSGPQTVSVKRVPNESAAKAFLKGGV